MTTPIIKEQDPELLAALPLGELNHEIGRCLWGYENGGTSQGRKSFFKRLVMLEGIREQAHGIPAKRRAFRAR
ncbi:hypothetical protein [Pseudoxanthomonas sp. PXM02]|uniref:hypothetical protein n=1 Tax=Pseudoxanthomonas sp. PXM02 TaxID=2769294 RepID=UPI001783FB40|nr:hypothetical protein [Pseudoxanthomonas sp. PXM02]MBD9480131.1 hypothetical protein [Pseudoxanthomonas sp. PXM02]